MIQTKNSNKDLLAKLMATEDINVLHKNVPTAYFDVVNRTLVCPILKEDMSPELYDLFMGHEVGHALNTPAEGWHDAVSEKGMTFKGYLNVIEDCRIEKMVKSKYPGLRRSFYAGYKELAHDDFFGIKDQNLQTLNLIDRINLFFKIGSTTMIEFDKEEQTYIKRCHDLNTFEEVMDLAVELFDRQQQITEEELESMTDQEIQDMLEDMKDQSQNQEEGQEEGDQDDSESMSVKLDETEDEKDSDGQGSDAKSEDKGDESDQDSEADESEDQGEESQKTDSDSEEGGLGKSVEEQLKDEINKSETDESFRKNETKLNHESDRFEREPSYYELPDKIKYENFIVDFKEINKIISNTDWNGNKLDRSYIEKTVKKFQDDNKKIIGYMVKEFEMKKAAAAYNRSWSSKSGELDMSKIHLFKLKDDIFNRVEIIPEGKNHGVVMLLDWSGSMGGSVLSTMEQASLLSMFCRRLSIPFRLFAFSDGFERVDFRSEELRKFEYGSESYEKKYEELKQALKIERETKMFGKTVKLNEKPWEINGVSLLEIFNDKMTTKEFNTSMENWFQLANSIEGRYSYNDFEVTFDSTWNAPSCLMLSGTPLDASLVIMRDFIRDFKVNYNLDICSLITLTDGASHTCFGHEQNGNLVDRKFNKTFSISKGYRRSTHALLEWVKETTGVRTIGFYLKDGRGRDVMWDAEGFCGTKMNSYGSEAETKTKEFNKLSTSFTDGSYDLAILINQKKLKLNYQEDELNVEEGATKAQLKRALVKSGSNKMLQRVILNQFVGQMAV